MTDYWFGLHTFRRNMVADKDNRGSVAELAVETELTRRGFVTSRPTVDARYDLVVDTGHDIHRLQIKRAFTVTKNDNLKIQADLRSEVQREGEVHKDSYSGDEIDAFAVYYELDDTIYWMWESEAPEQPCRNPSGWEKHRLNVVF